MVIKIWHVKGHLDALDLGIKFSVLPENDCYTNKGQLMFRKRRREQ